MQIITGELNNEGNKQTLMISYVGEYFNCVLVSDLVA